MKTVIKDPHYISPFSFDILFMANIYSEMAGLCGFLPLLANTWTNKKEKRYTNYNEVEAIWKYSNLDPVLTHS